MLGPLIRRPLLLRLVINEDWGVEYQLVPPDMHRGNAAERAIWILKAHFLSILAGVAHDFPRYLWDLLLPQAEMTLNFVQQAKLDPTISAWEYFNGKFDYAATPVGPIGCKVLIDKKAGVQKAWDFRPIDG